jgi:hypothetical protein
MRLRARALDVALVAAALACALALLAG